MKKIGIILRDYTSLNHNALLGIREDLIKYLRHYPVQVICIPVLFGENEYEELEKVKKCIAECDGIILPGGAREYDIDFKIVSYLYEHNIPTLGICLGMQVMALTFNGDIEPIGNDTHQKRKGYVHEVKVKEESRLGRILEDKKITVNSRHSDHITTTDLPIVAISNDIIIEAVEDPSKKFFIGVQWHPESLENDVYSRRLFDAFIENLQ